MQKNSPLSGLTHLGAVSFLCVCETAWLMRGVSINLVSLYCISEDMQPCLLQIRFTCDYSAFNNAVLGGRTLQTHTNRCTMLCKFLINRFTHLVSEVWRINCSQGLSWLPRAKNDVFKLSSLLNQESRNNRCSVYNEKQQQHSFTFEKLGAVTFLSIDSSIIWLILHITHVINPIAG